MAYVTRDLDEEDKDEQQQQQAPTIGGNASGAPTIAGAMNANGVAAPPQTPQQQKGTGFVNLKSWLDAGKGRDQAITDKAGSALKMEKESFGKAAARDEQGLAGQQVLTPMGGVEAQLDREAGVTPGGQQGPSLMRVLGQSYQGPKTIDYTSGQGNADLNMLGGGDARKGTSTIADVLAKPEIEAGRYGGGLRALDNVLFGADSASQAAVEGARTGQKSFNSDVGAKIGDFNKRVSERSGAMTSAANAARDELKRIGDRDKGAVQARADKLNAEAQAAYNAPLSHDLVASGDETGGLIDPNYGKALGEWAGAAPGSANAGNVQTAAERSRFAALQKLLGYDAPIASGPEYKAGSRGAAMDDPHFQENQHMDAIASALQNNVSGGEALPRLSKMLAGMNMQQQDEFAARMKARYPNNINLANMLDRLRSKLAGTDPNTAQRGSPQLHQLHRI